MQYIMTMHRVGKIVPPKRHILKDISLSFYYGAKIGILGLNGSGKSSLLRIIAGIDKDYVGEAHWDKNIKMGYLSQEPQLDLTKNVKENVEEGVREQKEMLTRFDEISLKFCEELSEDDMNKLLAEQGDCKIKLMQWARGNSIANLKSQRTPCVYRLGMRMCLNCRGESGGVWPCVACYCLTRMSYF